MTRLKSQNPFLPQIVSTVNCFGTRLSLFYFTYFNKFISQLILLNQYDLTTQSSSLVVQHLRFCGVQCSARSISQPRYRCSVDALFLCGSWASCCETCQYNISICWLIYWSWGTLPFLQRVSIACNVELCTSYDRFRLSVSIRLPVSLSPVSCQNDSSYDHAVFAGR